jgi:hypothetical protein
MNFETWIGSVQDIRFRPNYLKKLLLITAPAQEVPILKSGKPLILLLEM